MKKHTPAATLALLFAFALPAAAQEIPGRPEGLAFKPFTYVPPAAASYRAVLKSGPVVYLAEDHELPLVNIAITLRGGSYLAPAGKEGLADLTGYLLSKGGTAKTRARDLDEELAFLAANLNSRIGDESGSITLNLLAKDADRGLAILREILTEPAFEEEQVRLRKDQLLNEMKTRNDDSADIETRERGFLAWGESFYSNRYTTKASIEGITREDLAAFHRDWVDPKNMYVAVAGDVKRDAFLKKLDALFSKWPYKGKAASKVPAPTHAMKPGVYLVDKDVNQGRVSIMLPGVTRDDPDFIAALVMNDVLGGGGFTSRITNRVRSDEGLAYSAGSGLTGGIWYRGLLRAGFQSKVRTCSYASAIVLEEMKGMREKEVTDAELDTARKSFFETLPRKFATKNAIVGSLLDEEFTGRYQKDPNFYKNYKASFEKVTAADVKKVAARLLATPPTILVVGKKADLLNPDPKHPIAFASLTSGSVVDVPLRDPFTMKPTSPAASK